MKAKKAPKAPKAPRAPKKPRAKAHNARRTLFFTWFVTGGGAFLGSVLLAFFGKAALFAGGMLGGAGAVVMAVFVMVRFGWMQQDVRNAAIVGGLIGFALAAIVAVTNLSGPIIPVLSGSLAGGGVLMGVGFARKV